MSTLRVNNITDTSGGDVNLNVPNTAKAWVNFNGTGTVAIRASFNVSSITDNGTGDYTVNFTTALVDANYFVAMPHNVQNRGSFNTRQLLVDGETYSTTAVRMWSQNGGGGNDIAILGVAIFR